MTESFVHTRGSQSAFDAILDVLFFKIIRTIKTVGCYLYLTVAMALVSLLCIIGIVLTGVLVCKVLGTFFGVLTGLLLFAALLLGPFKDWMAKLTAVTKAQFFG